MSGLLAHVLWGWLWCQLSLALLDLSFVWQLGLSLPLALGSCAALGLRLPGGLGGLVVASVLLDAWSTRPAFVEALCLVLLWLLGRALSRVLDLTEPSGQAGALAVLVIAADLSQGMMHSLLWVGWARADIYAWSLRLVCHFSAALALASVLAWKRRAPWRR